MGCGIAGEGIERTLAFRNMAFHFTGQLLNQPKPEQFFNFS